ncbi:MAG TPA: hypothetical protein VJ806_12965 [Luteimonas sp.]|nr:hypothetical protein [Luteimonas sp.]
MGSGTVDAAHLEPWLKCPPAVRRYLAISAMGCAAWAYFRFQPIAYPVASQSLAFSPMALAIVLALGLLGAWLAPKAGFAEPALRSKRDLKAWWLPIALGLVYGLIESVRDLVSDGAGTRNLVSGSAVSHAQFPASLLFYLYGTWFLEGFLRVFWLPFFVFVFSRLLLRGRGDQPVFWIGATIAALYEPSPFMMERLGDGDPLGAAAELLQPLFIANLLAAWEFRRYGIAAPFLMRYAFYLIWHVLYGGLIYPQVFG